jgi:hypothetical protein
MALHVQSTFLDMSRSTTAANLPIVHWSSIVLKPQPLPQLVAHLQAAPVEQFQENIVEQTAGRGL